MGWGFGDACGFGVPVDTQAGKAGGDPMMKGWPVTLGIWGAEGATEFLRRGSIGVTKPVAQGKHGLEGSQPRWGLLME